MELPLRVRLGGRAQVHCAMTITASRIARWTATMVPHPTEAVTGSPRQVTVSA